jgi:hypothetical protein
MSQRSLAVIMIVVMVPVSVMAPCPRVFQVAALAFRLAAVLTMFALRIMQLMFRIADSFFAPSVVIAIKRPRGNYSAKE